MAKQSNLKIDFTERVLKNRYHMTREGIKGYWENKSKEETYNNKKNIAIAVGLGEAIGTAGFAYWDITVGGGDCTVPVLIFSGIAVLTGTIAAFKQNPYTKEEYEEIDEDYDRAQRRAKENKKTIKKMRKRMLKRK